MEAGKKLARLVYQTQALTRANLVTLRRSSPRGRLPDFMRRLETATNTDKAFEIS